MAHHKLGVPSGFRQGRFIPGPWSVLGSSDIGCQVDKTPAVQEGEQHTRDDKLSNKKKAKKGCRNSCTCMDMSHLDCFGIPCPYKAYPKLYGERKHSGKPPKKKFRFLDLFPEIRNCIYEHFLVLAAPVKFIEVFWERKGRNWYRREMHPRAKLLRVNKQINAEGSWFFYGRNDWRFMGEEGWLILYFWLWTIGPKNVRLVENITAEAPWMLDWSSDSPWISGLFNRCERQWIRRMGLRTHEMPYKQTEAAATNVFRLLERAGTTTSEEGHSLAGPTGLRSLRLVMPFNNWIPALENPTTWVAASGYPDEELVNAVETAAFPSEDFLRVHRGRLWAMLQRLYLRLPYLDISLVRLLRQRCRITLNDIGHPRYRDDYRLFIEENDKLANRRLQYGWKVVNEYCDEDGHFPVENMAWVDQKDGTHLLERVEEEVEEVETETVFGKIWWANGLYLTDTEEKHCKRLGGYW